MSVDHPMLTRASKNFEGLYMKSLRAYLGFLQLYSEFIYSSIWEQAVAAFELYCTSVFSTWAHNVINLVLIQADLKQNSKQIFKQSRDNLVMFVSCSITLFLQKRSYAPINVKPLGGRPGIGGGFDSSHRPVVGTFDRFNGLSSIILLTFSCYFDNPQMPWGGAFEQKLSAQFKCPTYARPPP